MLVVSRRMKTNVNTPDNYTSIEELSKLLKPNFFTSRYIVEDNSSESYMTLPRRKRERERERERVIAKIVSKVT
jgi:hypothetical protein